MVRGCISPPSLGNILFLNSLQSGLSNQYQKSHAENSISLPKHQLVGIKQKQNIVVVIKVLEYHFHTVWRFLRWSCRNVSIQEINSRLTLGLMPFKLNFSIKKNSQDLFHPNWGKQSCEKITSHRKYYLWNLFWWSWKRPIGLLLDQDSDPNVSFN